MMTHFKHWNGQTDRHTHTHTDRQTDTQTNLGVELTENHKQKQI